MSNNISHPPLYLAGLEGWRSFFSATNLAAERKYLNNLPPGDGHPVMVLPGFMAGDFSTVCIRYFLNQWGYAAKPWNLGLNLGLNKRRDVEKKMSIELEKHFNEHGRKVSLVGWSLGGTFARELAKQHPEWVRSVICLGSPIGKDISGALTAGMYQLISGNRFSDPEFRNKIEQASKPVPKIPCTAIFSKSDGIVNWKIAQEKESKTAENIEVKSAHTGLGMNASVMYLLADRLRQEEGQWKKFTDFKSERYYFA